MKEDMSSKSNLYAIWIDSVFLTIEDDGSEELTDVAVWKNLCHCWPLLLCVNRPCPPHLPRKRRDSLHSTQVRVSSCHAGYPSESGVLTVLRSTARYRKVLSTIPDNNLLALGIPVKMHSDGFRDVFVGPYLEVAKHLNLFAFVLECPLAPHGIVCHHGFGFLCGILVLPEDFSCFVISPFKQFDSV